MMTKKQIDVPSKKLSSGRRFTVSVILSQQESFWRQLAFMEPPESDKHIYRNDIATEFSKLEKRYKPECEPKPIVPLPSRWLSRGKRWLISNIFSKQNQDWSEQANRVGPDDDNFEYYLDMSREFWGLAIKYKPTPKPKPVVQPEAQANDEKI